MIDKIISELKRKRINGFLINNLVNIKYLTGFTGSSAYMLLTLKNLYLFTDFRYEIQAKEEVNSNVNIVIFNNFFKEFEKVLKSENIKKLGFEASSLTYDFFDNLKKKISNIELLPVNNLIEKFRRKKNNDEISLIKKSIKITERSLKNCAFYLFLKNINITEIEFKLKIEYEMLKNGAEEVSFPIIVLSGKNTSLVHGKPSNINLNKTHFLIDLGCKYSGYCSDKTVSFVKKNCELERVFTIVKDAKNFAIDGLKAGVKAKDIDRIAREYINKKGYGKFFGHSLGHGVGLEVHELPVIGPKSKDIIEDGDVFTIEPGIYIPEIGGIRLEDMVYIKKGYAELLTEPAEDFVKCLQD